MKADYNIYNFISESIKSNYRQFKFTGGTTNEHILWANDLKERLYKLLGIHKLNKSDINPELIEEKFFDGYTVQKWAITTLKSLKMPFYKLTPKTSNNKAFIAIHGHGSDGKEGLVNNESSLFKESVSSFNYKYALELMQMGYIVFVPDLIGAGERGHGIYKDNTAECNDINNALISLGITMQGLISFEMMQLTDHIEQLGFKDINVVGFSGGAFAALWYAIFDKRVNNILLSGYFHSFKDTILYTNRCGCNFIPELWNMVDMGDMLAIIADRNVYIETGNEDKLNGIRGLEGVYEQLEIANKVAKLYNKEIKLSVNEGGHKWYGSILEGLKH